MNPAADENSSVRAVHKPNKLQAILFFLFTTAFAAGILGWVFFLNKGTLVVNGEAPFGISVRGNATTCNVSPCLIKLKPGSFAITIKKEGFYDDVQTAEIKRGRETAITASFRFVPVVREVGESITPLANSPLRPPFIGLRRLENFPKDAKNIQFSASGSYAILTLGKELYEYDVAKKDLTKSVLIPSQAPAWLEEDIAYFAEDAPSGRSNGLASLRLGMEEQIDDISQYVLKRLPHGEKKGQAIVKFDRAFAKPSLSGSPSGRFVLIIDGGIPEEHVANFYLVDTAKKTRRRLTIEKSADSIKWVGDYLVFEDPMKGAEKVFALNPETLATISLPAADAENTIEVKPGIFTFITSTRQEAEFAKLGLPIAEAIEEAKKESAEPNLTNSVQYITEFDLAQNAGKTLATLTLKDAESIHRLTVSEDGAKLYFEVSGADGDAHNGAARLFEVQMQK